MKDETIQLTVYGAEVKCASCVNAPGSKETYEWLQAAISRKFDTSQISYQYVDIHTPQKEVDHSLIEQIFNDELFYPLVIIENEIVGEGNPRLKSIYQALRRHGLQEIGHE